MSQNSNAIIVSFYDRRMLPILLLLLCSSCSIHRESGRIQSKYLTLFALSSTFSKGKQHIILREERKLLRKDMEFIPLDDREIMTRLSYTREDRIAVLKSYFSFQGCQQTSDKRYGIDIGSSKNKALMAKENISFSVEVEALYSLSMMLLGHPVNISPVLINTSTGAVSNWNKEEMKEIFSIYKKWLNKMEDSNFEKLTWPLENSKYQWLIREDAGIILRPSL